MIRIIPGDYMAADLFARASCANCGKHGAEMRVEISPPDDSWLVFRFFCNILCLARWGCGNASRKYVGVEEACP